MSATVSPSGVAASIDPTWMRRLTIDEYHRMIDTGILANEEKVELLEGVIVAMSPHGLPHAWVIELLTERLAAGKRSGLRLRVQLPLSLARSEPEPDLALVSVGGERIRGRHPETAHLVVEVASESLRKDLGVKAAIYAEAGIFEYWIVDVADKRVHVLRDPDPAACVYRTSASVLPGDTLQSDALPGLSLPVADLFSDEA